LKTGQGEEKLPKNSTDIDEKEIFAQSGLRRRKGMG
jgi:hypothetical protein